MMTLRVTKRDGRLEEFNPEKVHRVINWAIEGVDGVSLADIELAARQYWVDKVTTSAIQRQLIKAAGDMIGRNPSYQWVASRLLNYSLRDQVWGGQVPPSLEFLIKKNVDQGKYDKALLSYSLEELDDLNAYIDHGRDMLHDYAGMTWLTEKYLVQDRATRRIYETPQFAYMAFAMAIGMNEPLEHRTARIKEAYDEVSLHHIQLATPPLAGARTPIKQFASCTLIDVDDTLDSIGSSIHAALRYGAQRAGLGLNVGRIRPVGSRVGHGEIVHTGVVPFLKAFETAIKSVTQGGIRSASATTFFPWWHGEVETMLVLKNPSKNAADRAVFKLDYCLQVDDLFYELLEENGEACLFNHADAPGLYDAFGTPAFKPLYLQYAASGTGVVKRIPAASIFNLFIQEAVEVGRDYLMNIDEVNRHSSFKEPVKMSNLCLSGDAKLLTKDGYRTLRELWLDQGQSNIGNIASLMGGIGLVQFAGENAFVVNESGLAASTAVTMTSECSPLFELELDGGMKVKATAHHDFELYDGGRKKLGELVPGDRLRIASVSQFGTFNDPDYAELAGHVIGDGSVVTRNPTSQTAFVRLWDDEIKELGSIYSELLKRVYKPNGSTEIEPDFEFNGTWLEEFGNYRATVTSCSLGRRLLNDGVTPGSKHRVPTSVWAGDRATIASFLRGLYTADGQLGCYGASAYVCLGQADKGLLEEVQVLLSQFGIKSAIHRGVKAGKRWMKDGKGGTKEYNGRATWRLMFSSRENLDIFFREIGVRQAAKMEALGDWLATHPGSNNSHNLYYREVESITYVGDEETFCLTEFENHQIIVNGIVTGQCMEIVQPTVPIQHIDDPNGEIGICMLSAINWCNVDIDSDEALGAACRAIVRVLDNIIDYQEYPVVAGRNFCTKRRSLAIGITGLATWLARRGLSYDDIGSATVVARAMERVQFNLIKASMELAIERGPCEGFDRTRYSEGVFPIDTYNHAIDEVIDPTLYCDWDWLRSMVKTHGMRHSTLTAQPPCESSSIVQRSPNGIEPPRDTVAMKKSRDGIVWQVMPGHGELKYDRAFHRESNTGYLCIVAAIQKFMDMAISANLYYSYDQFEGGKLPLSKVANDALLLRKLGLKTLYYTNSDDGDHQSSREVSGDTRAMAVFAGLVETVGGAPDDSGGCESGACSL